MGAAMELLLVLKILWWQQDVQILLPAARLRQRHRWPAFDCDVGAMSDSLQFNASCRALLIYVRTFVC